MPFIRLVAVCNNLAYLNAKESADIDLFIVVKKGRIWITKLSLLFIITFLGLRPPKNKAKDKIYLSFYVSSEALDISQIKIANDDVYLVYWLATLFPVYQRYSYYQKFFSCPNSLIRQR